MTLGEHMTLGDTSELTDNDRMLIEHMDIAQEGNGAGLGEIYSAVSFNSALFLLPEVNGAGLGTPP